MADTLLRGRRRVVNVGYRLPLEPNERWNVEFSLGAGVRKLPTTTSFANEYNGFLPHLECKKTFWIDNVAVSFSLYV